MDGWYRDAAELDPEGRKKAAVKDPKCGVGDGAQRWNFLAHELQGEHRESAGCENGKRIAESAFAAAYLHSDASARNGEVRDCLDWGAHANAMFWGGKVARGLTS